MIELGPGVCFEFGKKQLIDRYFSLIINVKYMYLLLKASNMKQEAKLKLDLNLTTG